MMFRLIAGQRNEIRRSDENLQTCFIAIDRNTDAKGRSTSWARAIR
jgi:hypothetical protein